MEIKTILNEVVTTLVIEKSKFISYLIPVESKSEANEVLENLRKKHFDATHVCYAYIINDEVTLYKSSDDGEPSQTAGAPILNVLRKNDLSNVVCAVVRYFGGIKLGAGGLTRAYSNSAIEAVNAATIVTLVDAYHYQISFGYDKINYIDKYFEIHNIEIIDKSYEMEVVYTLLIFDEEEYLSLFNKIEYMGYKTSKIKQVISKKKI